MSGSQGITDAARFIAVCGSFSPWPVSTQTTRPSAPYLQQPRHGGGGRRLAEHPLASAEQRVGVEDLLVGHGAHLPRER